MRPAGCSCRTQGTHASADSQTSWDRLHLEILIIQKKRFTQLNKPIGILIEAHS